jgi:serine/threonine protein kinase/TolB-like protein/Tfp pilus assembly protein PilF
MAPSRRDKVRKILAEAQSVPPEERDPFLRDRCEEESVRQEVASLLKAQEEAAGFYEALADSVVAPMLGRLDAGDTEDSRPMNPDPLGLEGTRVGRYEVKEHLGGGGMGIVYKARDPELGRAVALKFLPPHLSGHPEVEERFAREAKAAASLDHPHIATIYEIGRAKAGTPESGTAEGQRYIAMAYCEGETLKEKLEREGPLPVEEALRYAEQIAGALAAAHEAGVVHRDVKPANVMVTGEGEVKLLDFGLARLAEATRLTEAGRQLGTISYMSPEQARGEEVGPAADVWALGALLYEMVAGERPFQGERRAAVLHAVLREEPAPLTECRPDVPAALAQVAGRCLEKDPADRYGSAAALREDLGKVRSRKGSSSGAKSTTLPVGGAPSWPGRLSNVPRRWIAGGAALLAVLALVVAWWLVPVVPGEAPEEPAAETAAPAEAGKRSIAVLPFEPLSGGAESETFARGVHGDLLTRLSNISDLTVIARTSAEQYRDTELSAAAIAESLGVRWVMEGGVQAAGGQIQVNAQLIDPRTDAQVWAEDYRRDLTAEELFAIQEEITREIADALQARLSAGERSRIAGAPTENFQAYRLYARGRRELARRADFVDKHVVRAATLFRRAIEQDSSFALAWAGLADMEAGELPDSLGLPDVSQKEAARRALKLDPDLAEAHTAMGGAYLEEGKGPAALRALRRALELKPSYWEAHHRLGWLYLMIGRPDQALDHLTLAVELNPQHASARHGLYDAYLAAGQAKKSLEEARRQQRLGLEHTTAVAGEVRALVNLGRLEEARRVVQQQIATLEEESYGRIWMRTYLPHISVGQGDTARARREFQRLQNDANSLLNDETSLLQVRPEWFARIYAVLGETDRALETLERLDREDWRRIGPIANLRYGTIFFDFSSLRANSRYRKLVQEANQAWGLSPDGQLPEETQGGSQTSR